jgi:hypothetical protein
VAHNLRTLRAGGLVPDTRDYVLFDCVQTQEMRLHRLTVQAGETLLGKRSCDLLVQLAEHGDGSDLLVLVVGGRYLVDGTRYLVAVRHMMLNRLSPQLPSFRPAGLDATCWDGLVEKSVWKSRQTVGWIDGQGMGSGGSIDLEEGVRDLLVEEENESAVGNYYPGIHGREEVRQAVEGKD